MPNIRCKTCGLSMQIPAGGRRMCGCGAWLSADDEDDLPVLGDAEEPARAKPGRASTATCPPSNGSTTAIAASARR